MLKVEKLSWSFPQKDLFTDISFEIEDGRHCALIGRNGIGKSSLLELIVNTDEHVIYSGKIIKKENCRIGYVQQMTRRESGEEGTVYEYLCRDFVLAQTKMDEVCEKMGTAGDGEAVFEEYQRLLDGFEAIDGYNYEKNIHKKLAEAGLSYIEDTSISVVSGGEYKLVEIIRSMLQMPDMLIMDEPDAFLDFDNIAGLERLINGFEGTVLTATHNRFLLSTCFDQILHLENEGIRSFDGNYNEYRLWILMMKADAGIRSDKETDWIEIQERLVEQLRDETKKVIDPYRGKLLHARVSYLERLKKNHTQRPFLELREPVINFPEIEWDTESAEVVLTVDNYSAAFDSGLLKDVSFTIRRGEKLALVGPNACGKTTLLKDIADGNNPAIHIADGIETGFASQLYGETSNEELTVYERLQEAGIHSREEMVEKLSEVYLEEGCIDHKISELSGGEKNLFQLLVLSLGKAELLLLDEPTSHLDLQSQLALEKAVKEYKGAVLMVSHDYYSIASCAEAVLLIESGTVRRMSGRAFRKIFYKKYYRPEVMELEQKKTELEGMINSALIKNDAKLAQKLCSELESVIGKISG